MENNLDKFLRTKLLTGVTLVALAYLGSGCQSPQKADYSGKNPNNNFAENLSGPFLKETLDDAQDELIRMWNAWDDSPTDENDFDYTDEERIREFNNFTDDVWTYAIFEVENDDEALITNPWGSRNFISNQVIRDMKKTYDVHFNDDNNSNNKGFSESLEYCQEYINIHNGTNHSYFEDYKGGNVSIICNETDGIIHTEIVK